MAENALSHFAGRMGDGHMMGGRMIGAMNTAAGAMGGGRPASMGGAAAMSFPPSNSGGAHSAAA